MPENVAEEPVVIPCEDEEELVVIDGKLHIRCWQCKRLAPKDYTYDASGCIYCS